VKLINRGDDDDDDDDSQGLNLKLTTNVHRERGILPSRGA